MDEREQSLAEAAAAVTLVHAWLKRQIEFSRALGVEKEDGVESIMFFARGSDDIDSAIMALGAAAGVLRGLSLVANDG